MSAAAPVVYNGRGTFEYETHITFDRPNERFQDSSALLIRVKHETLPIKQKNIVEDEREVARWHVVVTQGGRALRFCSLARVEHVRWSVIWPDQRYTASDVRLQGRKA